ncbi:MAG: hypothetical protein GPOALKHO_000139 [Sodalis sp.]|nr:MAG: hypothetical protein GPOALKHO_000139 [Sodalis sp.]
MTDAMQLTPPSYLPTRAGAKGVIQRAGRKIDC